MCNDRSNIVTKLFGTQKHNYREYEEEETQFFVTLQRDSDAEPYTIHELVEVLYRRLQETGPIPTSRLLREQKPFFPLCVGVRGCQEGASARRATEDSHRASCL